MPEGPVLGTQFVEFRGDTKHVEAAIEKTVGNSITAGDAIEKEVGGALNNTFRSATGAAQMYFARLEAGERASEAALKPLLAKTSLYRMEMERLAATGAKVTPQMTSQLQSLEKVVLKARATLVSTPIDRAFGGAEDALDDLFRKIESGQKVSKAGIDPINAAMVNVERQVRKVHGSVDKLPEAMAKRFAELKRRADEATEEVRELANATNDARGGVDEAGVQWNGIADAIGKSSGSMGPLVARIGIFVVATREAFTIFKSIGTSLGTEFAETDSFLASIQRRIKDIGIFGGGVKGGFEYGSNDVKRAGLLALQQRGLELPTRAPNAAERRQYTTGGTQIDDATLNRIRVVDTEAITEIGHAWLEAQAGGAQGIQTFDRMVARYSANVELMRAKARDAMPELRAIRATVEAGDLAGMPMIGFQGPTRPDANTLRQAQAASQEAARAERRRVLELDLAYATQTKNHRAIKDTSAALDQLTREEMLAAGAIAETVNATISREQRNRALADSLALISDRLETTQIQIEIARTQGLTDAVASLTVEYNRNQLRLAEKQGRSKEYVAALREQQSLTLTQIQSEKIERSLSLAQIELEIAKTLEQTDRVRELIAVTNQLALAKLRADPANGPGGGAVAKATEQLQAAQLLAASRARELDQRRATLALEQSISEIKQAAGSNELANLKAQAVEEHRLKLIELERGKTGTELMEIRRLAAEELYLRLNELEFQYGTTVESVLHRQIRAIGTVSTRMETAWTNTSAAMMQASDDLLFNVIKGRVRDIDDVFQQLLDSILRQITNLITQEAYKRLFQFALNYMNGRGLTGTGATVDLGAGVSPSTVTQLQFATGGIITGGWTPIRAFASGGTVTDPTIGLVGEGRYNEAVVPLPNGTDIPVDLRGGETGGNREDKITIVLEPHPMFIAGIIDASASAGHARVIDDLGNGRGAYRLVYDIARR